MQYSFYFSKIDSLHLEENAPLSRYTSFRTGGNADLLIMPDNEQALIAVIDTCVRNALPYLLLGSGTNVLVSDSGIRGIVIRTAGIDSIRLLPDHTIEAGCGAQLSAVSIFAAENSLSGMEFACGIPGSVGGGVYMNAGAYGGEIKDVIISCKALSGGQLRAYSAEGLALGYRTSRFSREGGTVLSAMFRLQPGDQNEIRRIMNELKAKRKEKQPVNIPSAGSTFKRPEGYFAGTLIEQCGLKGTRVGGACVSEKHAGFIVNDRNATSSQIAELIALVQKTVLEKTGVMLETEVKFLGDF